GWLEVGRMGVHDGAVDGVRVDVAAHFGEHGAPLEIVIPVTLDPPLDDVLDPVPPALASLVQTIRGEAGGLQIGPSEIEARVPIQIAAPLSFEPTLEHVAAFARALRRTPPRGPYR